MYTKDNVFFLSSMFMQVAQTANLQKGIRLSSYGRVY